MNKLIILCLLWGIVGCNPSNPNKKSVGWHDFTGLDNLKLKGTVNYINNDIGNGYHGRGVIRITIVSGNRAHYDPSEYQENYYCKIKDNEAEIYDNNLKEMNIGDTVYVDTSAQTISWKNKKIKNLNIPFLLESLLFLNLYQRINYRNGDDKFGCV